MLRARRLFTLVIVCCVIVMSESARAQIDQDERLIERLHATITDAEYIAVDLDKVIDDLRAKHDLNIQVSWRYLEILGVRRDHRIEVRLKQVSLATLIDNVLREAGVVAKADLTYTVSGGVVVITTADAVRQTTMLRIYDIADFLESGYADRRFFSTPLLSLAVTGREAMGGENVRPAAEPTGKAGGGMGGGGFGGGGGSPFEIDDVGEGIISDMELARGLIELIIESVTPEHWEQNGGLLATVRYHDGRLIVQNTIEGHRKMQAFLEMLRQTRPVPLDGEAMIVRVRSDRAAAWREGLGDSFPRLDAAAFERLRADQPLDSVLFRGSTSGHNGRRLWFSALTQRDLVVDVSTQPTKEGGQVAFSPERGFVTEGLEMIALPLLSPDRATLRLDVQMAWIPEVQISQRTVRVAAGDASTTIDQVVRSMRTVSTSVTLRPGQAVVLSIPGAVSDLGAAPEWQDFLILRVADLPE